MFLRICVITYLLCAKKLAENYQFCLEFQVTFEKTNSFKSIYETTIWVLPINLDVL